MGRPTGNSAVNKKEDKNKNTVPIKAKRKTPSGSHLGKSNYYKGDFQKVLGNANTGRGYTLVQKQRLLSRFKKKVMRRKSSNHDESGSSNNKSLYINAANKTDKPLDETIENETTQKREKDSLMNGSTFSLFKRKKKAKETNIKRVEIDYNVIQEERRVKAAELQASRDQHEEMVARNILKRKNITKRLSQRTKRGQPIMANRLELMLDKIKKS